MLKEDGRSFVTGPRMINPIFGVALALGCLALASAQILAVVRHVSGSHPLAAQEPVARGLFAAVFLLAACGIVVALLEYRNARVDLDEDGITVCSWSGCRRVVSWEQVETVGFIETDETKTDVPWHRLYIMTQEGRSIRLAGGPWRTARSTGVLRRELVERLGLEETGSSDARCALFFPATKSEWS